MSENIDKAQARYDELAADRLPFLTRAREAATYTIPSLVPPEGANGSTKYLTPYQSLGARGVNNLASKMILALLPPSSTFFRLLVSPKVAKDQPQEDIGGIEEDLSLLEQDILKEIEKRGTRIHVFEAFKHLIVSGNALVHLPKTGLRVFPLSKFVVQRDPEGTPLEIMVKECVSRKVLPEATQSALKESEDSATKDDDVDLYTWLVLEGNTWRVHQETKGIILPDSEATYPKDKCPWLPLRWTRIDGESYGRGLCEEHLGDLKAFEGLSKAIYLAAQMSAKIVFGVNPNGMTDATELANAESGAVITGNLEEDVSTAKIDKYPDMQIAAQTNERIDTRLSYAFLLNSAIQRNGERVTAEEIRTMAGELEDALGGVYSVMSAEFQMPLVRVVMAQMQRTGSFPAIKDGWVEPAIVTGLDALGRSHEVSRIIQFLTTARDLFPNEWEKYADISGTLSQLAAGMGVNKKVIIRSNEEVAQIDQIQKTQALAERVGPQVVQGISQNYQAAQAAQQAPPQAA